MGARQLTEADFVLVIASPEYRRRADGAAGPDEGRGAQFEAAIIRNNLTRNLREQTERVLPVVLPGRSVEDIPTFLNAHSTTTFHVRDFTEEGVRDLLTAITGHGRHPMPERGRWLGGAAAVPERRETLLTGLPWSAYSSDLRPGSARIDGVNYDDSIVLRKTSVTWTTYVVIDLGGAYQRLTSVVGACPTTPPRCSRSAPFRVYLDDSPRQRNWQHWANRPDRPERHRGDAAPTGDAPPGDE